MIHALEIIGLIVFWPCACGIWLWLSGIDRDPDTRYRHW